MNKRRSFNIQGHVDVRDVAEAALVLREQGLLIESTNSAVVNGLFKVFITAFGKDRFPTAELALLWLQDNGFSTAQLKSVHGSHLRKHLQEESRHELEVALDSLTRANEIATLFNKEQKGDE